MEVFLKSIKVSLFSYKEYAEHNLNISLWLQILMNKKCNFYNFNTAVVLKCDPQTSSIRNWEIFEKLNLRPHFRSTDWKAPSDSDAHESRTQLCRTVYAFARAQALGSGTFRFKCGSCWFLTMWSWEIYLTYPKPKFLLCKLSFTELWG